jgi:Ca2+-binding EF-hand superfamily protein
LSDCFNPFSGLCRICERGRACETKKQQVCQDIVKLHVSHGFCRGALLTGIASFILGGFIGGVVQSRRLGKQHEKSRRELIQYAQLQEEISKQQLLYWQKHYNKLYTAYEQLQKETVERDCEEFKAPDTDNDDMISREEFDAYVRKYLSSFPELSEKDFPKFEEFDLNHDGIVSFDEWQEFLAQQKLKEAEKAKEGAVKDSSYNDLLDALYDQSHQSDGFGSLQKNIANGQRGAARRQRGN